MIFIVLFGFVGLGVVTVACASLGAKLTLLGVAVLGVSLAITCSLLARKSSADSLGGTMFMLGSYYSGFSVIGILFGAKDTISMALRPYTNHIVQVLFK